jgi:hypothetical protein
MYALGMTKRVLIIGGYGNFGGYIAKALAPDRNLTLVLGGRSLAKARQFAAGLVSVHPSEAVALDIFADLAARLAEARPDIVVHTTGPFQNQSYADAEACLKQGCHYIDLADARRFVTDIGRFNAAANEKKLLLVSGASSVPCLTAAVIDHYRKRFRSLDRVDYGITAAQQTNRGLATSAGVLSYVGKPFTTLSNGQLGTVYGWQDLHRENYPELGWRLFGNCDIPDLALFPARYPELRTVRFSAGHEIPILHLGLWGLSWLVRMRLMPSLDRLAPLLLKMSFLADPFGSSRSGFHMFLGGIGIDGSPRVERFYIVARSGHGPYIPCMPAILLAKGLANGGVTATGAHPCLDLIDLETYVAALKGLDISIVTDGIDG